MMNARLGLQPLVRLVGILGCFLSAACEYDVPIATVPSGPVTEKLLGDWVSIDGKDTMKVRPLDANTYVVSYNQDLYSAQHTDVAGTRLVSVLHLEAQNRKYAFLGWSLEDNGERLRLRVVSSKLIPKETRDSATLQELLKRHLNNPALFGFQQDYLRAK